MPIVIAVPHEKDPLDRTRATMVLYMNIARFKLLGYTSSPQHLPSLLAEAFAWLACSNAAPNPETRKLNDKKKQKSIQSLLSPFARHRDKRNTRLVPSERVVECRATTICFLHFVIDVTIYSLDLLTSMRELDISEQQENELGSTRYALDAGRSARTLFLSLSRISKICPSWL